MRSNSQLRKLLMYRVAEFPRHYLAAKDLEITGAQLSQMLLGRIPISEKVARKLGFVRVWGFVKLSQ